MNLYPGIFKFVLEDEVKRYVKRVSGFSRENLKVEVDMKNWKQACEWSLENDKVDKEELVVESGLKVVITLDKSIILF